MMMMMMMMMMNVGMNGVRAVVSTLAGGVSGNNGAFADSSGTNAGFSGLFGVAVDASGNVFVGDQSNQRIRKVTAGGGMLLREECSHALSCLFSVCVCAYEFNFARSGACIHILVFRCADAFESVCFLYVCVGGGCFELVFGMCV